MNRQNRGDDFMGQVNVVNGLNRQVTKTYSGPIGDVFQHNGVQRGPLAFSFCGYRINELLSTYRKNTGLENNIK